MNIIAICGSLQAQSRNLTLLRRAVALAPVGLHIDIVDLLRDLPLFNPDIETPPTSVDRWRATLVGADGILIATPEYGHSLPGALKNGVDWVIQSGELHHKPVAVTASVGHADYGKRGVETLCITLRAVDAQIASQGTIVRDETEDTHLRFMLERLAACVKNTQERTP